jgi:hypothetical protein
LQTAIAQEDTTAIPNSTVIPNGSGAAAVLSAGIGSFAVALFSIVADKSVYLKNLFVLYKPTGPLSGVTTAAILLWLAVWATLLNGFGESRPLLSHASTSLLLYCSVSVYC